MNHNIEYTNLLILSAKYLIIVDRLLATDVLYYYRADLHGIRNRTIVMWLQYFYALYTSSFKSIS